MSYRPFMSKRNETAQRAIGDALLKLLADTHWNEISVKALCECAGVSRPTFYRHFDELEDVLGFYALTIQNEITDRINELPRERIYDERAILCVFEQLDRYRALFDVLRKNNLLAPLFGYLWANASKSFQLSEIHRTERANAENLVFVSGGIFSLAFAWVLSGMDRPPMEVAKDASLITRRVAV